MPHVKGSRELLGLVRTSSRVGPRLSRSWPTIALVALVAPAFASLAMASERPIQPILVTGGSAEDGGPLVVALKDPEGLAFGPDGRLYVADRDRDRIFAIDLQSRIVEEIAGPAWRKGEPLPALSSICSMRGVQHVGIEPDGAILFSSHDHAFLCRYDPRGRSFSTVAGKSGKEVFGGDGGLAAQATIRVSGFTCDREGNILIAGANRIRRISRSTGLIQTIAGTGKLGFFGDGGRAIAVDP
jgi:hypothetical protein